MILLSCFIPGVPVAQPRTKARAFVTAGGKTIASVYTPTGRAGPWKERVALEARMSRAAGCFADQGVPVMLTIRMVFPRPKAKCWKTRPQPAEWMTSKPDFDNLAKAVCDVLSGVVFRDDSQVCSTLIEKTIAAGGMEVGAFLHVESLDVPPG